MRRTLTAFVRPEKGQPRRWLALTRLASLWADSKNVIRRQDMESIYEYQLRKTRQHDEELNLQTEPPEGELIDLKCLWVIEYYSPSHIDQLLNGLRRLGWTTAPLPTIEINPSIWIRKCRDDLSSCFSWYNLNPLRKEKQFASDCQTELLPSPVDEAFAQLICISPSLICIVICFVFNDAYAMSFNKILRSREESRIIGTKREIKQILTPYDIKKSKITQLRKRMQNIAIDFISNFIPGVFSSARHIEHFPTCELLTFHSEYAYQRLLSQQTKNDLWLRVLDLSPFLCWESSFLDGLLFFGSSYDDDALPYHWKFVAKGNLSNADKPDNINGDGSVYPSDVNISVAGLLSRLGLPVLLSSYEKQVGEVRDSDFFFEKDGRGNILRQLTNMENKVIDTWRIPPILDDLARICESKTLFEDHVPAFVRVPGASTSETQTTLTEELRRNVRDRARRLLRYIELLQGSIDRHVDLNGIRENIKLQNRMLWLTIFIAVLTIAMLISSTSLPKYLLDLLRNIH